MAVRKGKDHASTATEAKVRYAVVGLGHIAQVAALPAFEHARQNSELTALVSDDPVKLKKLGRRYGIEQLYPYDEYQKCLRSGEVDAVYIALPNHLHRDYAVRAARAGIHVLCEKPLAVTARECEQMIRAAEGCAQRSRTGAVRGRGADRRADHRGALSLGAGRPPGQARKV